MVTGTQAQQVQSQGLGLDQIADVVNRSKIGDVRKQREMMRMGISDPGAFALQNQAQIQQAQQPSEFIGIGNRTQPNTQTTQVQQGPSESAFASLRNLYGLEEFSPYEYTYDVSQVPVLDAEGNQVYSSGNAITGMSNPVMREVKTVNNIADYVKYNTPQYTNQGFLSTPLKPDLDIINEALSGREVGFDTLAKYVPKSNEIIPRNPAYGQLSEIFNSLYGTDPMQQMMQSVGKKYGLTPEEVNRIAGTVMASRYAGSTVPGANTPYSSSLGRQPFAMGVGDLTPDFTEAMHQYLKAKGGTGLSPEIINAMQSGGADLARQLKEARAIESHSGGMFSDALPFISTVLKFTPLAPVAYAYDAYNAIENNDPLGVALAALGGYNQFTGGEFLSGVNDTISSNLGVSKDFANAISSGALGGLANVSRGGDFLSGALGGGLGGYAGSMASNATRDLGEVFSKGIGGATSGALNSLFTKNSPIQGALFGGMSGGLHGYLNTVGRGEENRPLTREDNLRNQQIARNTMQLAKLFRGK